MADLPGRADCEPDDRAAAPARSDDAGWGSPIPAEHDAVPAVPPVSPLSAVSGAPAVSAVPPVSAVSAAPAGSSSSAATAASASPAASAVEAPSPDGPPGDDHPAHQPRGVMSALRLLGPPGTAAPASSARQPVPDGSARPDLLPPGYMAGAGAGVGLNGSGPGDAPVARADPDPRPTEPVVPGDGVPPGRSGGPGPASPGLSGPEGPAAEVGVPASWAPAGSDTGALRRRRARRPARVRTRAVVRHVDVVTVARVSALFYLVVLVVIVVASLLLWLGADAFGSLPSIERSVRTLFSLKTFTLHPAAVAEYTAAAGVVIAIAGTLWNILMALIYNLIADVVGGARVELESFTTD